MFQLRIGLKMSVASTPRAETVEVEATVATGGGTKSAGRPVIWATLAEMAEADAFCPELAPRDAVGPHDETRLETRDAEHEAVGRRAAGLVRTGLEVIQSEHELVVQEVDMHAVVLAPAGGQRKGVAKDIHLETAGVKFRDWS